MSLRRALGALLVLAMCAGGAQAQDRLLDILGAANTSRALPGANAATVALPPMGGPVDPAEYVVGPGDVLQINLAGGVTRSWDVVVAPEGTLFVPSVGVIAVAGRSLVEARQLVVERVSREYRGVNIDLRLLRPRVMLVQIAGETRMDGSYQVPATSRLSEILVDSLFSIHSSRRNIEIRRRTRDGEVRIPVDLQRYRLTGRGLKDPLLRDGDVIFVPVSVSVIGILGAVGRPNEYEFVPGDSLSTLLELAGGPQNDAVDRATLVRFRSSTQRDSLSFSVSEVLAGRGNLALQDGDRVFVYFEPRYHKLEHASILGEVQRPGSYPIESGRTKLSDLVSACGGFLGTADLAALRVFRANLRAGETDPEISRLSQLSRREMTASEYEVLRARMTAQREEFRVDWNRVKGHPELDMILRGDDVVRVDAVLASVRIEGEVRRPGVVAFEPGRRVGDYVKLAGGFSNRASRGQVRITRAVTGQTIQARDASTLEPGDLIWVPERGETAYWQTLQSVLLVLAQIATVIVAVRR